MFFLYNNNVFLWFVAFWFFMIQQGFWKHFNPYFYETFMHIFCVIPPPLYPRFIYLFISRISECGCPVKLNWDVLPPKAQTALALWFRDERLNSHPQPTPERLILPWDTIQGKLLQATDQVTISKEAKLKLFESFDTEMTKFVRISQRWRCGSFLKLNVWVNVILGQKYFPPNRLQCTLKEHTGLFQCEVEAEWRGSECHGYNDVALWMEWTKEGH